MAPDEVRREEGEVERKVALEQAERSIPGK
jgi:hypothetical protein